MTIRTIIHDVDGCLKHWTGAFCQFLDSAYGLRPTVPHTMFLQHDFSVYYPDMDTSRLWQYIEEFNRSEIFEALPNIEGAADAVTELRRRFPGVKQIAITSTGIHPHTVKARAGHVAQFGLDAVHVLPLGGDKTAYYERYAKDGTIVIDDHYKYVEQAVAAGCHGIMIDRSYNQGHDHLVRARNWPHVVKIITGIIHDAEVVSEGVAA